MDKELVGDIFFTEDSLLKAIREMQAFESERGERISIKPNEIIFHPDKLDEFNTMCKKAIAAEELVDRLNRLIDYSDTELDSVDGDPAVAFSKDLWPGIEAWYGESYAKFRKKAGFLKPKGII